MLRLAGIAQDPLGYRFRSLEPVLAGDPLHSPVRCPFNGERGRIINAGVTIEANTVFKLHFGLRCGILRHGREPVIHV